jgi:hypothetical protein
LQRIASHSRANNAALDLESRLFGLREISTTAVAAAGAKKLIR